MTRCIVCGKKFEDDANAPGPGDVEVLEGAIKFYDPTRGKDVYRHEACDPSKYVTKEKAEKSLADREKNPVKVAVKLSEPKIINIEEAPTFEREK